jgi:ABC-type uncharacterized transport system permease subunit
LLSSLIAVACYLIGAAVLGLTAYRADVHLGRGGRLAAAAITLVGLASHAGSLIAAQRQAPGVALSLGDTASIVGLVIAAVGLVMTLRSRPAGAAALLLAIAAVLEAGFSRGGRHFSIAQPGWELTFHVAVATTAFAMLTIGAALAAAQAVVDRRLRSHRPLGILRIFSPIESLESGCFQAILAGFLLLTLALVSGAFFIDNLFAQHLVHKVVLAIVAWLLFGMLLVGRLRFGWRGRRALRWALSGYALLALAYFGSKLVLETVLGRHWG